MFSHIIRVRGIFDDEPTTKKLYFHMSRREMFDFIKRYDNVTNFEKWLQAAIDNEDLYTMMKFFDDLIGTSYGERQGERFVKSEQIRSPSSTRRSTRSSSTSSWTTQLSSVSSTTVSCLRRS